jgi:hypothetical protein
VDLREQGAVDPRSHWYFRSKARPLLSFLGRGQAPSEIVDVGAGDGFFGRAAADACRPRPPLTLVDDHYAADEDAGGETRRRALPERLAPGALVLLMDVLEHVDDDAALLRDAVSRCRAPARFFITAPAHQGLWSGHDEFLGHRRRYTLNGLEAVARGAGLRVDSGYYYFGLLLAPAWLKRRVAPSGGSELRALPRPLDAALAAACALEHPVRRANRLGGLTCVVEAGL